MKELTNLIGSSHVSELDRDFSVHLNQKEYCPKIAIIIDDPHIYSERGCLVLNIAKDQTVQQLLEHT